MAKKIVLDQFTGITPRAPNHALPTAAASSATNARLSDSTIRPFYEPVDSTDTNSDLSVNYDRYTNFFKASVNEAVAWMSWTADQKVSVLEVRYNDVDSYDYPKAPEFTVEGGQLSVLLAGPTVIALGVNAYSAALTYAHISSYAPAASTVPLLNQTQQVTASLAFTLDTISTYAWAYVSGDATITIDDPAIADPTFTCPSLDAPSTIGTIEYRKAIYEVTITDASANTGTRQVSVVFNYSWKYPSTVGTGGDDGGGGGGGNPEPPWYRDSQTYK